MYQVKYTKSSIKEIKKLNKNDRALIMSFISKNLINSKNPKLTGKKLSGNLNIFWRYRVGNYRIITEIIENEVIILVVMVEHRSNVYQKIKRALL